MRVTELREPAFFPDGTADDWLEPAVRVLGKEQCTLDAVDNMPGSGADKHLPGEELNRQIDTERYRQLGHATVSGSEFWENGLEPHWFCFSD